MNIFYSVNPPLGTVLFEFSRNEDAPALSDFEKDVGAHGRIIVNNVGDNEFMASDALRAIAGHLWNELGDTPTDSDGVDGKLDDEFYHFPKGTAVYDVWAWFEVEFNLSISADLMHQ
ncbi:hypothetical protein [Pseudoalteromonas nigrifaciens]|uniref:hypothetical protein n=1 Tax=Pseudoalteromonas nigrifaciens TaxID=28109 RepID=UPI003FD120D9